VEVKTAGGGEGRAAVLQQRSRGQRGRAGEQRGTRGRRRGEGVRGTSLEFSKISGIPL
jgi:hypothetical protein